MRQSHLQRSLGIWIAAAAVLLLALLMLGAVTSAAQPVGAGRVQPLSVDPAPLPDEGEASPQAPSEDAAEPDPPAWRKRTRPDQARRRLDADRALAAAGAVTIQKSVATGSGDNDIVYNGQRITYTLTIRNDGTSPATNVVVYDPLPGAVDGSTVACAEVCSQVVEFEQIPTPLGGLTTVSVTVEVTWSIESLAPGAALQRVFSARVVGQPDGAVINNTAELGYDEGIAISNETETTVLVRVDAAGGGTVADVPTWVSSDLGGTMSLDWGDFDGDGYLDLALGSTVGTSVYRNDGGHLAWCWGNDKYTLGVRWADVNGDGDLELVAVGESGNNNSALAPGTNYVFDLEADCTTATDFPFGSSYQLLRVEPGAYVVGDSDIHLIASTNAIDVPCPVGLYKNVSGDGDFGDEFDQCISGDATANIAAADRNDDLDLDLALGRFPNTTCLLSNDRTTTPLTLTRAVVIDTSSTFLAYDFAWGDYDRDGYLDLAAAHPLERKVRIYRNLRPGSRDFKQVYEFPTSLFRTPQAIDWGDFDGDGYLDLAVADAPPRIYFNRGGSFSPQTDFLALPQEAAEGQIWAMAAADADNDGDLDLALGNWKGASLLFTSFGPFLDPALTPVGDAWPASGVAWGDANGDGDQDLLFGSGGRTAYARLYPNQGGDFPSSIQLDSRYGPHDVAFGDVDGDGQLDVALGSVWLGDRIYLGVDRPAIGTAWQHAYSLSSSSYGVAWGDVEGDGDLDLLAGGEGPEHFFVNGGTALDTAPAWSSRADDDTRSLAWGDYDGDGYADFAVGNDGQPNRLYHNEKDRTFSLVWSSGQADPTRSVAWGDYDGDGDLDLAVGNYGQANLIYQNLGGLLDPTPIWRSEASSATTSLAWGDWDNDGDLDLAVGNDGQPDQVYGNQGSTPGAPRLLWLWTSADRLKTSDIAWGDRDGDGDLDLAISQTGTGWNGYYENGYVLPAHLEDELAMPLPNNPSYLAIERPGVVEDAYYYSTWELLGYGPPPTDAVVTAEYTLFDPEGDDITEQRYEYSLDGGGTWHEAGVSAATVSFPGPGTSQAASFEWNAQEVEAISDDARFRITIVHNNPVGPVQRAATSATSPPFRVRGTGCVWPVGPSFVVDPDPPQPGEEATFEGELVTAEGPLAFTWDFGDGATAQGQVVGHTYASGGLYLVRMTVATTAADCPPRVVKISRTVRVGRGPVIHLPLVTRSATISIGQRTDLRGSWPMLGSNLPSGSEPGAGQAEPAGVTHQSPLPDEASLASESGWPADRHPPGWRTTVSAISLGEPTSSTMAPAQVSSIFPDGVFITFASETMTVTEGLDGIHSQPSIAGNGEPIAFWSTASRAPAQVDYVRISEVDPGGADAIEFYNPSNTAVDMTGYVFTGIRSAVTRYTFPDFILDPGAFVLVHETSGVDTSTDLYMGRNIYWVHGYPGSASLVDAGGQGVDFVRWGNASDPPPSGTAWISPNPLSPLEPTNLGRDGSRIDSNSGLDWCSQPPSLGVQNAACEYDASGNIEVFLAEELSAASPSWKQVTFSTGNILGGFNLWPSINISGTRIAFFSDRDLTGENGDENFEIFVYDGTHADPFTQVTVSEGGVNIWPSTNVSGTRIAFASDRDLDPRHLNGDNNQEIFLAELADGGTVSITQVTDTEPPVINDEPSISGDGRRIAYARYGVTGFPHLWLYDVVGQGEDRIVAEGINIQPSLNYTGTRLAFVSTGNLDNRRWNPDKSREIFTAEIGPFGNPTFSQVTSATTDIVNDQPSISADGERLAFVSGTDIWLYDDYGAPKAILLSTGGGSNSRPSISGNGLYVAFAADNQIRRAFSPLTDLAATKLSEPDVVVPGQDITYIITFANRGLDDIVGAAVSDTIPAAVLSPQWDCSLAGCPAPVNGEYLLEQTVNLPQGASLVYTVTGTVDESATGTLTNTAVVTPPGDITDQKPLNNSATVTNTLVPQADLVLSKSVDRDPVAAGEILTYTLDYTNDGGPSDAWDLVITDRLPFGVSFGGMESGPDPTSQQDGLLTWNIATLAAGDSDQLVFSATVASWLLSDTITNTASITASSLDLDPGDNDDDLATNVTTSADLILAKTAQPDPVVTGGTLTYTLLYNNAGPSDARKVYITDTLPVTVTWDGTVLAVDPPLCGPTQTAELNTWYWYTPLLPAGAAGVITFEVTVSDTLSAAETIVNSAVIHSHTDDDRPRNNDDDAPVDVVIPVDLAVAKIARPEPIDAGEDITYTIVVSNLGSYTATSANVYDDIPQGDIKDFRWTCESTSGSTCTAGPSGKEEDIDDTVTIAPGGLLTYTVIGEMKANAPSLVYNTVTATVAVGFTDTNPDNNSDTFTSTVTTSADLVVTKSVNKTRPNVGETIIYTLIISNPVGPSDANNVVLTDTMPLGIEYESNNHTKDASYDPATRTVRWDVGRVRDNEEKALEITATVSDTGGITITNVTDGLRSDAYDPDDTNNTGRVTITVNLPPSMDNQILPAVDEHSPTGTSVGTVVASDPNPGDTLAYDITAGNTGSAFAIDPAGGEITVDDNGALDHHTHPTFTLAVEVTDAGGLTASAVVTIPVADISPDVTVGKTADPANLPEPGGTVAFTVSLTNNTAEPITLTHLIDDLHGDLNGQGTCGTPWMVDGNGSDDCTFTAAVNGDAGYSETDVVTATVQDNEGNTDTETDSATVSITDLLPDITVSKTADPADPLEPGGTVTFTVIVTNTTVETATLILLTDDLHGNLNGQGTCATGGTIAGDASYSCAFSATVSGDAGESETDTVTATVRDDENNTDTETGSATVAIADLVPDITVGKTADPTSVPETGGTVTFTVSVTLNSTEAVTLTGLSDDLHGDLDGQGNCAVPQTIAGGLSYSCTFTATVVGDSPGSETDTVTATVQDDDGNQVEASDDATVTFSDVLPDVTVTKTASPTHVLEPGGTVTYTIGITNNTAETVTLASLTDDLKGDLAGEGTCDTPQTIAGNLSYSCTFTRTISGSAGESDTDTVTATVRDDEQNQVTPTASATVTIVPFHLTISGPPDGLINTNYTFTATVHPTASLPITYTWQATGKGSQPPLSQPRLTDTISYTWSGVGTKFVTVTATCLSGTVTSTFSLSIYGSLRAMAWGLLLEPTDWFQVYLPLVLKGGGH